LRFDSDETSRNFVMSLQSICVLDGKPVHIKPGSRREVLELAFHRKTQTVDVVCVSPDKGPKTEASRRRGKQHRRPRFSSTHNVKHPRTNGRRQIVFARLSAASVPSLVGRPRLR